MRKNIFLLLLLVLILIFAYSKFRTEKSSISKSKIALDTFVEIFLDSRQENLDTIIDSAYSIINFLENELSFYKKDNTLGKINSSSKSKLSKEIYELLKLSDKIYIDSDSLLDVSSGALLELWNIDAKTIPSEDQIIFCQKKIGFYKVSFDSIWVHKPYDLKLNFGALAKGYIINKVLEYFKSIELESGFINAGGDIIVFGRDYQKIGIRHPRALDSIIKVISVKNKAVVTSGDYERFFVEAGKRYHHIVNPKTGYPSDVAVSVTVIDEDIFLADALSTSYFLLGPDRAIQKANEQKIAAIVYYMQETELKSKESTDFAKYTNF